MNYSQQLLPGFLLRLEVNFANFFSTESNHAVVDYLIQHLQQQKTDCVYVSGAAQSGKSHLLQAACNAISAQGKIAFYLPLKELIHYSPEQVLEGIKESDLLCIDEVECVAARPDWQQALFHLYNRRLMLKKPIFFAANVAARQLPLALADLVSRMCACVAFHLPMMSDAEKSQWIQHVAEKKGMQLNAPCAQFLLQHYGRSIDDILQSLTKLDQASLANKRKITIPFIKHTLG